MTGLDRFIQRMRIDRAIPHVPAGAFLLDIGCSDGPLFARMGGRIAGGIGIDPDLPHPVHRGTVRLYPGHFPDDLEDRSVFDAITMLAVLEHIPQDVKPRLAAACAQRLKANGKLILTVPSASVDRILDVLRALRLIDGMALEEHHGFDVEETPAIFESAGLRLVRRERFQFGLNHLFVFEKPSA